MKFKLPIFLSLSIIFSLSLLPSFSSAQSVECPAGALFSTVTGQRCGQSSTFVAPLANTSLTCLSFTKNLSFGQRSADMIKLQQFLKTQGDLAQSVVVSTNFGPATLKAVQKFQLRTGIVSSARTVGYGNVGPNTRAKIKTLSCSTNSTIGTIQNSNGLLGNLNNNTNTNNTNTNTNTQSTTTTNTTSYTITASAGTGGSISPSGAVSVASGASRAFTMSANSGYQISQVLVNNSNQGAISSYTFSNVTANSTIAVSFSQVQQNQGSSNQCNDGIDNDSDGLVDWQYDLGCYGPNDTTESSGTTMTQDNGWTVFEKSADTRIIYVSNSTGNDTNDGLTPNTAKKTIGAGMALMRTGFPDWLLLKRGDTWTAAGDPSGEVFGGGWTLGGPDNPLTPIIVATYGSSIQRPIIKSAPYSAIYSVRANLKNIAIIGLDLYYSVSDPQSPDFNTITITNSAPAIGWGQPVQNLLLEDMAMRFFVGGIDMPDVGVKNNVTIRRSIISDSYRKEGGLSSGMFISHASGVILEENVFDHNGWLSMTVSPPTQFNHNMYLTSLDNLNLKNNIIANGSSMGTKLRSDTVNVYHDVNVENNFYIGNSIGVSEGTTLTGSSVAFRNITIKNNVITENGSNGIDVGGTDGTVVDGNIITQNAASQQAISIGRNSPVNISVTNNTIYNSKGYFLYAPDLSTASGVLVSGNKIQNPSFTDVLTGTSNVAQGIFQNNTYVTGAPLSGWFTLDGSNKSFSEWQSQVESTASNIAPTYPDPTRTAGTYNATLGGTGTTDAFLTRARQQSKYNWSDSYTANAVNNYIRAGFGR
jgi:hypothetical protein